jgi:hypothetical protein
MRRGWGAGARTNCRAALPGEHHCSHRNAVRMGTSGGFTARRSRQAQLSLATAGPAALSW